MFKASAPLAPKRMHTHAHTLRGVMSPLCTPFSEFPTDNPATATCQQQWPLPPRGGISMKTEMGPVSLPGSGVGGCPALWPQ